MSSRPLRRSVAWATLAVALVGAPLAARVIAIGDIHGELPGLLRILQVAELVDQEGRWIGGGATLVQTGDYLDRGPDVRAVMNLLRRLQQEAAAAGGEVVVLLGNHEAMNLSAIDRDVGVEAYAAFVDEESEERREESYQAWLESRRLLARLTGGRAPLVGDADREAWMDEHPLGWVEYHLALGPEGDYGRWLRERPVIAVRGDTLFLHAGLAPEWAEVPLEEIEERHARSFAAFDRTRLDLVERGLVPEATDHEVIYETLSALGDAIHSRPPSLAPAVYGVLAAGFDGVRWLNEPDSPLWFRGYARSSDAELAPLVETTLAAHGVERIAAAHSTLSSGRIQSRLGGKVFLVDTGMLTSVYGGRPSALVIDGDRVSALYGDEQGAHVLVPGSEPLDDSSEPESVDDGRTVTRSSAPPPGRVFRDRHGEPLDLSEAEVLEVLRSSPVREKKPIGVGVTGALRLVLDANGRPVRAAFHAVDQKSLGPKRLADGTVSMFFVDSFRSQIAAYELARLMGLDRVPPTVARTIDRDRGSVQLWIEDAFTFEALRSGERKAPDPVRYGRQMADMRVWDNLIYNPDRNEGNILFDPDWNLWWIDHTRAFGQSKGLGAPELLTRLSLQLWKALRELDGGAVEARLAPYLSQHEIKALMARRDALVRHFEERIAQFGREGAIFPSLAPEADSEAPGDP